MTRYEFSGRSDQAKAAVKRLLDARHLQTQERWRGAMYLAGYSVECRLKARLMELNQLNTLEELEEAITTKIGRRVDMYTHSIEALFALTGARDRLLQHQTSPAALHAFQLCNRWKPAWRYNPDDGTQGECSDFLEAVDEFARYIKNNI